MGSVIIIQNRKGTPGTPPDTNQSAPFQLPLTGITHLTIPLSQHQITQPSCVTVMKTTGAVVFCDVTIDPATAAVSIALNKPFTGLLLIR